MLTIRPSRIAAVVALGLLAACSADSALAPSSSFDLSAALGELSPSSVPGASSTIAMNSVPATSAITPSSCAYASGTQSFTCPSVTVNGVTIARSFTLLDASGASQSAFDKATTAAVRVNSIVSGAVTGTGATIADTSAMTLSGLLTGTHTLDGVDHAHLNVTSSTGTVATNITTTISGLVLPAQKGGYPASGTITTTTASASSPATSFNTIRLSFNGTSKVAVTMTTSVTTRSCTLDLANTAAGCI